MKGRLVIAGLLLAAAAQIGAWFFDSYDRVERDIYVGYRGEARYNPFLAAQRLAEALGYETDSRAGLEPGEWLPPISDTLVLADRHGRLSEVEIETLLRWAFAGGSLVAAPVAGSEADNANRLLDLLNVQVSDADSRETKPPGTNAGCAPPCETDVVPDTRASAEPEQSHSAPKRLRPTVSVNGKTVRIRRTQPRLHLDRPDILEAGGDSLGTFYARFAFGQGRITLVADTLFCVTTVIGGADNAAMVADLVQQAGGTGKVWFIYDDSYPGIMQLIWKHAPVAVAAFALLLALYLWRISRRFGPMLARPAPRSRSVLEHIRATGLLLWTTNNQRRLVDAARGRLLQTLERHHPGISHGSADEQVQSIAEHSGEPVTEVATLFKGATPAAPGDFTQRIVALQRLWKKL